METLKYRIIKNGEQYKDYCNVLEDLLTGQNSDENIDEIELLTLLIEKYDYENDTFGEVDPVTLLQSLMNDHEMKAKDIVGLLNVSKGYVSDILHYRKGMSKEVIRKLADHFKVNQAAFNRQYSLKLPARLVAPSRQILVQL